MKQYHITLSEEDIRWLEVGIDYLQNKAGTEGISETIDRIIYQAKEKALQYEILEIAEKIKEKSR